MIRAVYILRSVALGMAVFLLCGSGVASARDAAFLTPGVARAGSEAIKVDPKPEIEVGETATGVAKRVTVFFVNQTNSPVKIERISLSSDALVSVEEVANDCTKQGSVAPLSKCSVELSVVPTGPGTWSVDVLMTHRGAGRIARARLFGRTSAAGAGEARSTGLAVSAQEVKPVDFGEVTLGAGKIARSSLMVNDSSDPIVIYSIDVVEASNGLQRLSSGCAVGMELEPGASCPVTLVWEPFDGAPVSTDLIIRHSGKMGFSVVPVRGTVGGSVGRGSSGGGRSSGGSVPLPPTAHDLERAVSGTIEPVPDSSLGGGSSGRRGEVVRASDVRPHLIGTIGRRALFLLPSGNTTIVAVGASFAIQDKKAKLLALRSHSADIMLDGKRYTLRLEAAPSLVSSALEQASSEREAQGGSGSSRGRRR